MHGIGGDALILRDVAERLGPDQPVYGLRARGLDGRQPRHERIEDMVETYVSVRLRAVRIRLVRQAWRIAAAARVREATAVEIPLVAFFDAPTIADLAAAVTRQAASGDLEAVLSEIEALSEDDARRLLAAADESRGRE